MKSLYKVFAPIILVAAMVMSSCDSEIEEPKPQPNNPIVTANAGADQEVNLEGNVILDASGSTVTPQKPLSYFWKIVERPEGSTTNLVSPLSKNTTFVADKAGQFKIELKVSSGNTFDKDTVLVYVRPSDIVEPQAIALSSNILNDMTLENIFNDPSAVDYVVTADIRIQATLTIMPGVRIEFEQDKGFEVTGALYANGNAEQSIYFTGKQKQSAYWKGLLFISNSQQNVLNNVVVEYGGSNSFNEMPGVKANVALYGNDFSASSVTLTNSILAYSGDYGLFVAGRSSLENFSSNWFDHNAGKAAFVPANNLHRLDIMTHFSSNGFNGVETGGTVDQSSAVHWNALSEAAPYLVTTDMTIKSGIQILPGANFRFLNSSMVRVKDNGYLYAVGYTGEEIKFTAHTPNNFWAGILIETSHPLNQLEYCHVQYAGAEVMPGFTTKANVAVAANGKVIVKNSILEHGQGWGIAANQGGQLNADAEIQNAFSDLLLGNVKLTTFNVAELQGDWVDQWSFMHGLTTIDDEFYNEETGVWFHDATDPWSTDPKSAIGLRILPDGSYIWTIAENSPWSGCVSYSAEFITGSLSATGNSIDFTESYWRDKYFNSCDPSGNVDWEVTPSGMSLRYEINLKQSNTGAHYWELKLINPDDSFFTYFKAN